MYDESMNFAIPENAHAEIEEDDELLGQSQLLSATHSQHEQLLPNTN